MRHRIERINELSKNAIGGIFARDLSLKEGVLLTVTKVDTSPDLSYTRVFVSVFPEAETRYAEKTLEHEAHRIQSLFAHLIKLRAVPHIEFRIDTTEVAAQVVEDLFKEIESERNGH